MGKPMIYTCLVVALCAHLSSSLPVSNSLVVSVRTPVSVGIGHTTTLPCWINPSQSVEGLEVRWYLGDHFDAPIMLYQARKLKVAPLYAGRVTFALKDATSGGLKTDDVSLELLNVTLEDAGDYTCYVSSDQHYDKARVNLTVTAMGTHPILSAVFKDNLVNVSCGSEGWYPQPQLRWLDHKQDLTPKGLQYRTDSSGLLSVHSWILVSNSSEVSCSVGLSDEEAKEARLHLESYPQQDSGSSATGWVAFTLLLIAVLALLGVLIFKKRALLLGKRDKSGSDEADGDHAQENQKLLSEDVVQPIDRSSCIKHYVNVKLDGTENPYLRIKGGILRDRDDMFPDGAKDDGAKVTCLTAIKGTPGFSSGQHYWEVSLWNTAVGFKRSWWVGVTSAADIPKDCDVPLNTSNGFWFLSSSPDRGESFQFSTEPNVLLPVSSRPKTVGVFLNYDSGELSFYNVEDKSLICSLTASFKGEQVFPFFNPGIGDKAAMEILQLIDTDNFADLTLQEMQ